MCGIAVAVGPAARGSSVRVMLEAQRHRGPDAEGWFEDAEAGVVLGHTRLAVLDLSDAGRQPMADPSGRYHLVYNGEVYNYRELKAELADRWTFRTATDTEVLLAAYVRWGPACLERLLGMFAFAVWDARERTLFAARDRFGVKPLHLHRRPDGSLLLASEVRALLRGGVSSDPDPVTWSSYLATGLHDHGERTFYREVRALPAGHHLTWRDGSVHASRWYDLTKRVGERGEDGRTDAEVKEEYAGLLEESIRLRFRSDVPVGINLSGGVDSSTLLATVQAAQGPESDVKAFTFVTGHQRYDELPWVERMLERTRHPSVVAVLRPDDVPELATSVQETQDGPFGGIPTLAYARLFERARDEGVVVLLDGQGMDEQWAGYDYYRDVLEGRPAGVVQGTSDSPVRPACLRPGFRRLAGNSEGSERYRGVADPVRRAQLRDIERVKLPRALRFNDRVSMRASRELREPFLDHRLVELALAQPVARKIGSERNKTLLRSLVAGRLPSELAVAPKRPVQTPQREWLRGPLAEWAEEWIRVGLDRYGDTWLDRERALAEWSTFRDGQGDNSFFAWQWINVGLWSEATARVGSRGD